MRRTATTALALYLSASFGCADKNYDVIMVGSGPGGLVAAEYLTRDSSISVLVLEAGGPSLQVTGGIDVPSYAQTQGWTRFDIPGEYGSVAFQADAKYRPDWIASPTSYVGKVVGGSSSLNAMLYFHPPDSYIQEISWPFSVDTYNTGFSEIEKLFSFTYTPSTDNKFYQQEAFNIISDALNSSGYQATNINDQAARNSKSKTYGHPPFAIRDGLRDSPAKTFYGEMKNRSNFKLQTFATVSHIVQSVGHASGVVYSQSGQSINVNLSARGVVVMAAGALSTPKVLIQSGIGPKSQLNMLFGREGFPGIKDSSTWVVNENVGNSIFDTTEILTTFSNPSMIALMDGVNTQPAINQYMSQGRSGPWASPDPVLIGYENYTVNGFNYQFQLTGFCHGFNGNNENQYGVAVYLNNPKSRDVCGFTSDGKWHGDTKNSMYFSNNDDLVALSSYMSKLSQMLTSRGSTPIAPSASDNIQNWVSSHKVGTNHYGGSCYTSSDKSDQKRCSDESFRVIGTSNIYVADASLAKEGTVNPYGFVMYAGYQAGVNVKAVLENTNTSSATSSAAPSATSSATSFTTSSPIAKGASDLGNNIASTSGLLRINAVMIVQLLLIILHIL